MMKYRTVTLAVVALFLSVSFLPSSVVAAEMAGVMMTDDKMMMDGKMMMEGGKGMMGDKGMKMEGMDK